MILNMSDFIVFIELSKELEKGKTVDKRYIYFRGDSGLEAGSRFEHVPNRIEYGFREFIDTVENAILAEYDGDKEAVEKAKAEQEIIKEAKTKEYLDEINNSKTTEELVEEISELIKNMDRATKVVCANFFKESLGDADYRKSEDVKLLEEALQFVKGKA